MKKEISTTSKWLLVISAIFLAISIIVPIWRIELDAPQYPEGLGLQIFSYKLGGDVAIINGLNHYIGMQTLHEENFIEFTLLPFIIGFYALLMLFTGLKGGRKILYTTFTAFVVFGIIAMIDFWRWEYNYGHKLDPNAAIIVPGMAYQPPLIGFKQLLNFGAYSIPDIGGWLFIGAGLLCLIAVSIEAGWLNKWMKTKINATLFMIFLFASCSSKKPEALEVNKDQCEFCKMAVADVRFGAESISSKGRIYKFDDLNCMISFKKSNEKIKMNQFFVNDYEANNQLIDATTAWYIMHETVKSPMGSNTAAFSKRATAQNKARIISTEVLSWDQLKY
ncbi:nitrous oxide reductase accessory protein NosL [Sediminibacterium sp.]|uniref:nitrous oxide reductase accessory protein NosL n=1 Tax=Sediminibacterium sp. TaxID=1917865 RepID=UPI003F720B90